MPPPNTEGAYRALPEKQGGSLRDEIFFLLRTPLKDRPKGPSTANRQLPSTANRHQPPTTDRHQPPPTASGDQPPTANHCQPPPTTDHQPPTAANHHQPPPTASCQLPTANRRQPPTANRHQPWLSTWSTRGLFWENWFWNTFFFFFPPLRTPLAKSGPFWTRFPPMATATAVTTALPGTGRLSCVLSPRPQTKPRFTVKTPDCVPNLLVLPRGRMLPPRCRWWAVRRAVTGHRTYGWSAVPALCGHPSLRHRWREWAHRALCEK